MNVKGAHNIFFTRKVLCYPSFRTQAPYKQTRVLNFSRSNTSHIEFAHFHKFCESLRYGLARLYIRYQRSAMLQGTRTILTMNWLAGGRRIIMIPTSSRKAVLGCLRAQTSTIWFARQTNFNSFAVNIQYQTVVI